jgi:hypothetical protein
MLCSNGLNVLPSDFSMVKINASWVENSHRLALGRMSLISSFNLWEDVPLSGRLRRKRNVRYAFEGATNTAFHGMNN